MGISPVRAACFFPSEAMALPNSFTGLPPSKRRSTRRPAIVRSALPALLALLVLAGALCGCLAGPASAAHTDAPVSDQLTAVVVQPFAVAESVKWSQSTPVSVCRVLEQPANVVWRSLNAQLRTPRCPAQTLVGLDVRLQI